MSMAHEPLSTLTFYAANEGVTQGLAEILSPLVCGTSLQKRRK